LSGSSGSATRRNREARIHRVLEEYNPWWRDPEWYLKDEDVQAVEKSGIVPRVKYWAVKNWIKPVIEHEDQWGIIVIRGPRRIGKTTLLKLLIREILKLGVEPGSIIYLSLDIEELRRALIRGEISLRGFLSKLITNRRSRYGKTFLFIDEATFYMQWATALKNLVDAHVVGPGVLVIVTGSYSLELSQAKRELEGRMGDIGERAGGQRFYYPLRFSEVLDSISEEVSRFLNESRHYGGRKSLRKLGFRLTVLEELATPGETRVLEFFDDMKSSIGDVARSYFETLYIYTGGFPSAIYSVLSSPKRIVRDEHYTAFYELLVEDAKKFTIKVNGRSVRLSTATLERVLRDVLSHRATFTTSLDKLQVEISRTTGGVRRLKRHEARAYLEYLLEGARVLLRLDPVRVVDRMTVHTLAAEPFKLVYLDPLVFNSVYWVSRGVRSGIYEAAKGLLGDTAGQPSDIFRQLYEAVVCSHVARVPSLKYGADTANYGVGVAKSDKGPVEYADCVAWYYDKRRRRQAILAVEVNTSRRPKKSDFEEKALCAQRELMGTRLIIATRDTVNLYEYGKGVEAVLVPASLLLLLI